MSWWRGGGRRWGHERGSGAERKRKFLASPYQEEWTPLLLSLTVGNAEERRREADRCSLIH